MSQAKPHFTTVAGKQIHYAFLHRHWLKGERPLLVFLHEGLGSISQWKGFPLLLSEALQCPALLYDRYGYGLSEERTDRFYPEFLHDEALKSLPELFENLGIADRRKILFGHSDGATIALIHASAFPENTVAVISEAAHVMVEEATLRGIISVWEDYGKRRMRELLRRYHGEKTDQLVAGWVNNWLADENLNWNIEGLLPMIKCPVLAIQGDEDHFGTFDQMKSIKRHTGSRTELLYLKGCGHIPHKQAREEVLKAITDFIDKNVIIHL